MRNSVATTTANRDRVSGTNSMQRSNAGMSAPTTFGAERQSTATNQREFTPPVMQRNVSTQQQVPNNQANPRAQGSPAGQNNQPAKNGWQHFTPPPSRGAQPTGSSQSPRQYQSPANGSRGGNTNAYNRPPLNMNKPIVQPRGAYPNASRGGYPGALRGPYPAGPAGVYRGVPPSPAQRGVPSVPPSNSAPRGNSSGAPRGGSTPHGGGGSSHSGGGHSR
jgi:uncharacterized membrane protein YgcG